MASLAHAWHVFRGLSRRDRALLFRAWWLLFLVTPGVRLFRFRRMQTALGAVVNGAAVDAAGGREELAEAQAVALAVHRAANWHPLRPNCLPRALVVVHLLRRRGLAADLRIGVAKPGETLAAHAWVEHGGVAIGEADTTLRTYAPFDEAVLNR